MTRPSIRSATQFPPGVQILENKTLVVLIGLVTLAFAWVLWPRRDLS